MTAGRCTAAVAALIVVSSVVSCGDSAPSRTQVIDSLTDEFIVPTYERLATVGVALDQATVERCASVTDESHVAAASHLAEARAAWSTAEAVWLGPVMERRSWALVDWPVTVEKIDDLLADRGSAITAERIGTQVGADVRGLGAYEYLLDRAGPGEVDARVCDYLLAITSTMSDELSAVRDEWTAGASVEDPLDSLVNDSLFLLEAIADLEMGAALGVTRAEADPEAIHEGPAGLGVADIAAHLVGVREVFDGLSPLLSDGLGERLTEALDTALADVEQIEGPLGAAVVETPDDVARARDSIKSVQVLIGTEVVSELGVTIGFSDADGDTGA